MNWIVLKHAMWMEMIVVPILRNREPTEVMSSLFELD
jgi:hypothetical protein